MSKRRKLEYLYVGVTIASIIANILCIMNVIKKKSARVVIMVMNIVSITVGLMNILKPVDEEDEELEYDGVYFYSSVISKITWIITSIIVTIKDRISKDDDTCDDLCDLN